MGPAPAEESPLSDVLHDGGTRDKKLRGALFHRFNDLPVPMGLQGVTHEFVVSDPVEKEIEAGQGGFDDVVFVHRADGMVDCAVEAGSNEMRAMVAVFEVEIADALEPFGDDNGVGIEVREIAAVPSLDERVPADVEVFVDVEVFMDADRNPDDGDSGKSKIADEVQGGGVVAGVIDNGDGGVGKATAGERSEATREIGRAVSRQDDEAGPVAVFEKTGRLDDLDRSRIHILRKLEFRFSGRCH